MRQIVDTTPGARVAPWAAVGRVVWPLWVALGAVACLGSATETVPVADPAALPSPDTPDDASGTLDPGAPAALPPDRIAIALDIPAGSSFGEVVAPWGLPGGPLREAALEHHDLARIDVRRELAVVLEDGVPEPVGLRYAVDGDTTLVMRRDPSLDSGWRVWTEEVAWTIAVETRSLTIEHSLWNAGLAAGLGAADLARIAAVFEYEVDFNTELRAGAHLGLVAEVLRADGHGDRLGIIHAARLENDGRVLEAIRFVGDEGEPHYYHPDHSSTERAFLRSPLAFGRVTSGFNPRRFHPILKRARPHNGTDFGAPTGTPVRSVASGVVTYAGRSGGHGRFVKVRHDDVYETSYSHLSSISVRKGQRIAMGQTIGAVGATGLATGPHLHYQMWRRGQFVNAMREKLPTAENLPSKHHAAFDALVERWLPEVPRPGHAEE